MLAGSWMVRPPLMARELQVMKMAGLGMRVKAALGMG